MIALAMRIDHAAAGGDFEAGIELHSSVREGVDPELGEEFYQACVEDCIRVHQPVWARIMTLGRRKFAQKLTRDERQCFRAAGLLNDPPTDAVIAWWDRVGGLARFAADQVRLERSRDAEKLSFDHEVHRLIDLKLDRSPKWIAIEDNTAGYDVLSFDPGPVEPVARLIEVKSTIMSPLRFQLTRNEWEQALKYGAAYHFHVWDMAASPPRLYQRTVEQVAAHVPSDNAKGKWKNAEIPVGC